MNVLAISFVFFAFAVNPVSKASFINYLKLGLEEFEHFVNIRNVLFSLLLPDSVDAKNITIKLGFIGALDRSLGATSTLGRELVGS